MWTNNLILDNTTQMNLYEVHELSHSLAPSITLLPGTPTQWLGLSQPSCANTKKCPQCERKGELSSDNCLLSLELPIWIILGKKE
jgi:hypothetical protein